jgi:hypothetical protein
VELSVPANLLENGLIHLYFEEGTSRGIEPSYTIVRCKFITVTLKGNVMKVVTLMILAGVVALGGCASTGDGTKSATASNEQVYTPLGSLIAKKGPSRNENGTVDLQSFDNNRTMNNGSNSALGSSR